MTHIIEDAWHQAALTASLLREVQLLNFDLDLSIGEGIRVGGHAIVAGR